ncbi:MAG: FAD-dependent oxidoreductase, partial [Alphaproteobacteria bacterium]
MKRPWEEFTYSDAPRADCGWRLGGHWPRLEGEAEADVAIIGGGYTGLSAALYLAEAGADVAVLEARVPGWGASGRNGGFCCLGGALVDEATLARRFGADAAGHWVEAQKAAVTLVADRLARYRIAAQT